MKNINIKIKKLHSDSKVPFYASEEAAGFDFYSPKDYSISPGKVIKIPTGLAFEIPKGFFIKMVSRSGLASKGIYHMESIIDSDYRGEVHFILFNTTSKTFNVEKGQRIAQGLLIPIYRAKFKESKSLSKTKRGEGGFHSTGSK